jgi:hypothetical protein
MFVLYKYRFFKLVLQYYRANKLYRFLWNKPWAQYLGGEGSTCTGLGKYGKKDYTVRKEHLIQSAVGEQCSILLGYCRVTHDWLWVVVNDANSITPLAFCIHNKQALQPDKSLIFMQLSVTSSYTRTQQKGMCEEAQVDIDNIFDLWTCTNFWCFDNFQW